MIGGRGSFAGIDGGPIVVIDGGIGGFGDTFGRNIHSDYGVPEVRAEVPHSEYGVPALRAEPVVEVTTPQ